MKKNLILLGKSFLSMVWLFWLMFCIVSPFTQNYWLVGAAALTIPVVTVFGNKIDNWLQNEPSE